MKNEKNEKPVRKPLKELTLLDRFLFDTAMSDPEICRNILSIIFGEKEVPPGLIEFLHYAENPEQQEKEIQDERVRKLAGQIEMLKNSQEVGVKYMRLWEELEEVRREGHDAGVAEGRASGLAEGHASGLTEGHALGLTEGQKAGAEAERLESIRKLMETMNWMAEQAMDALQIPMEEREKYRDMINGKEIIC